MSEYKRLMVPGQSTVKKFVRPAIAYLIAIVRALIFLGLPVILIGVDLALSYLFMGDYAGTHEGVTTQLDWLAGVIGVAFTTATTGTQFLLNDRRRDLAWGKATAWVRRLIIVAEVVRVIDTVCDVGGFTSLWFSDAEVGAQIVAPGFWENPLQYPFWLFCASLVGFCCFTMERLIPNLLGDWGDKHILGSDRAVGARLAYEAKRVAGGFFSIVEGVLEFVGIVAVIALNILLPLWYVVELSRLDASSAALGRMQWVAAFLGGAVLFGMVWLVWVQMKKVLFARREDGRFGISHLSPGDKLLFAGLGVFAIIKAIADTGGFTALVYGHRPDAGLVGSVLPPQLTTASVLTSVIIFVFSLCGSALIEELGTYFKDGSGDESVAGYGGSGWDPYDPYGSAGGTDPYGSAGGTDPYGRGDDDGDSLV